MDQEEASLKNSIQKEFVNKAEALLFSEKEKVRLLRSQQLYSNVVATREIQIKEKVEQQKQSALLEKNWQQTNLAMQQDAERKTKKETSNKKLEAIEYASFLARQQLENSCKREEMIRRKKESEAECMRVRKIDDFAVEQMNFLDKIGARSSMRGEMVKVSEDRKKVHEKELEREQLEAKRREEENARSSFRATKRAELEKKYSAERILLSERAAIDLELRAKKEVELFVDGQGVRKINDEKMNEKGKASTVTNMDSLINLGRQKQIKLKQKQREQILKQENCFLDEYKQMNTEQHEREKREALEKRIQSIKLRNFQEKQIIENKEAIKEEKKNHRLEGKKVIYANCVLLTYRAIACSNDVSVLFKTSQVIKDLAKEEKAIQDFVAREIDFFHSQGMNTTLLEKVMKTEGSPNRAYSKKILFDNCLERGK